MQQFIETSFSMPEYSPPADRPEVRERMRTIVTEYTQRVLADPTWPERRQHVWLEPPAFQRLSELHVPTLLVMGAPLKFDAPQYIEALSQAIAGAKVILMPTGESNWIDLNEAFNRIVLGFLDAINRPPRQ
jgi:hypothetical protein